MSSAQPSVPWTTASVDGGCGGVTAWSAWRFRAKSACVASRTDRRARGSTGVVLALVLASVCVASRTDGHALRATV